MIAADIRRPALKAALPLALLALTLTAAVPAAGAEDAKAAALADRVLDAMGGEDAWQATRFLRFNFFGFRTHHWDRYTGAHRFEGKTREGESYVVLHDLDSREGEAWLNGEKLDGEALAEWLERAYGAWINDTYWLIMPYKLRDPGVHLAYDGEEEIDGVVFDKLLLTFDGVGLTPGDRYWAFIRRDSGLMERWAYHLQDWEADKEPTHWQWLDWQPYGGIKLSPRRVNVGDGSERMLGDVAVFDQLPESVFTSPEPVAAE
jgi:hypothetical protein